MREFRLKAAAVAVALAVALVLAEAAARLLSSPTPDGRTALAGVPLPPRSWEATVARNREILRRAPPGTSYFVADELLGWTVGASRTGRDGLYASSVEGIRSARPGAAYAAERRPRRVALVGDSFTFGLEVPFEDSWGERLRQRLGPGVQVLNFGVDGYGVDQTYLRYLRDVRPWRPDLVIFGFINHDLYRSMAVYAFMSFPEWGIPFGKPRFVLESGRLELRNTPVPAPARILELRSASELPFVELDPGYRAREWEKHFYDRSLVARFVVSRFRHGGEPGVDALDPGMAAVNAALLASFVELAREAGSAPYLVYFPSRGDFTGQNRLAKDGMLKMFAERGFEHDNLTACVARLGESRAFIADRPHYSAEGNAAVAACLEPAVRARLQASRSGTISRP